MIQDKIRNLAYSKWQNAGYPDNSGNQFWLEAEYEVLFRKAMKYKRKEQYDRAILIFKRLKKSYPNDSVVLGMIGTLYFLQENYLNAAKISKKTVKLAPKSQLASLNLFHSYIKLGKKNLAEKEVDRYLSSFGFDPSQRTIAYANYLDGIYNKRTTGLKGDCNVGKH